MRRFNMRRGELKIGSVVNGRVFYPGLGLSFEVPSDWQLNLQPSITKKNKSIAGRNIFPLCIQYGEIAVYFQAAARTGAAGTGTTADTIQVEGGPFIFRSLGRTVGSIRQLESSYQSMKGVRIVRPLRFYQLENMDFAEFDVLDETNQILYRHVFARSGDTRLDFVLTTSGVQAPPQFNDFVRSIRITRRPTLFND
jgi:hypothetical protein